MDRLLEVLLDPLDTLSTTVCLSLATTPSSRNQCTVPAAVQHDRYRRQQSSIKASMRMFDDIFSSAASKPTKYSRTSSTFPRRRFGPIGLPTLSPSDSECDSDVGDVVVTESEEAVAKSSQSRSSRLAAKDSQSLSLSVSVKSKSKPTPTLVTSLYPAAKSNPDGTAADDGPQTEAKSISEDPEEKRSKPSNTKTRHASKTATTTAVPAATAKESASIWSSQAKSETQTVAPVVPQPPVTVKPQSTEESTDADASVAEDECKTRANSKAESPRPLPSQPLPPPIVAESMRRLKKSKSVTTETAVVAAEATGREPADVNPNEESLETSSPRIVLQSQPGISVRSRRRSRQSVQAKECEGEATVTDDETRMDVTTTGSVVIVPTPIAPAPLHSKLRLKNSTRPTENPPVSFEPKPVEVTANGNSEMTAAADTSASMPKDDLASVLESVESEPSAKEVDTMTDDPEPVSLSVSGQHVKFNEILRHVRAFVSADEKDERDALSAKLRAMGATVVNEIDATLSHVIWHFGPVSDFDKVVDMLGARPLIVTADWLHLQLAGVDVVNEDYVIDHDEAENLLRHRDYERVTTAEKARRQTSNDENNIFDLLHDEDESQLQHSQQFDELGQVDDRPVSLIIEAEENSPPVVDSPRLTASIGKIGQWESRKKNVKILPPIVDADADGGWEQQQETSDEELPGLKQKPVKKAKASRGRALCTRSKKFDDFRTIEDESDDDFFDTNGVSSSSEEEEESEYEDNGEDEVSDNSTSEGDAMLVDESLDLETWKTASVKVATRSAESKKSRTSIIRTVARKPCITAAAVASKNISRKRLRNIVANDHDDEAEYEADDEPADESNFAVYRRKPASNTKKFAALPRTRPKKLRIQATDEDASAEMEPTVEDKDDERPSVRLSSIGLDPVVADTNTIGLSRSIEGSDRVRMKRIIASMDEFRLVTGDDPCSHLVCDDRSGTPRRTFGVLLAITRGAWILSSSWLLHREAAGIKQPAPRSEAQYEITAWPGAAASRALSSARMAGGGQLLTGTVFIAKRTQPKPEALALLCRNVGLEVDDLFANADFCLVPKDVTRHDLDPFGREQCSNFRHSVFVSPQWLIDSIADWTEKDKTQYRIAAPKTFKQEAAETMMPAESSDEY